MRRWPCFVAMLLCATGLGNPSAARADGGEAIGVVLAVGVDPDPALLEAARTAEELRWRLESLAAAGPAEAPGDPASLEALNGAWNDADFARCMELSRSPELNLYGLLGEGARGSAARVGFLTAACAHRLPDPDRARRQVDRLFALSLDDPEAIAAIRAPDFLELVEGVRAERVGTERRSVTIATAPPGAHLLIDGGAQRCDASPCTFYLERGEHVIVAERLGSARRVARREVHNETDTIQLELDPASAEEAQGQLADALREGMGPGEARFVEVAAIAYGANVLVVAFEQEGAARAVVFDGSAGRVRTRSAVRGGAEGLPVAVRTAVTEWAPATPVWPWVAAGAATAVAVGVALYFLLQPEDRFVYEFQ